MTLLEALHAIPDHRTRKGRHFALPTILLIALAAILSGANDLMAIYHWADGSAPRRCKRSVPARSAGERRAMPRITMFSSRFPRQT